MTDLERVLQSLTDNGIDYRVINYTAGTNVVVINKVDNRRSDYVFTPDGKLESTHVGINDPFGEDPPEMRE